MTEEASDETKADSATEGEAHSDGLKLMVIARESILQAIERVKATERFMKIKLLIETIIVGYFIKTTNELERVIQQPVADQAAATESLLRKIKFGNLLLFLAGVGIAASGFYIHKIRSARHSLKDAEADLEDAQGD